MPTGHASGKVFEFAVLRRLLCGGLCSLSLSEMHETEPQTDSSQAVNSRLHLDPPSAVISGQSDQF